jgi:SOS-response transcriptional repressor LexA
MTKRLEEQIARIGKVVRATGLDDEAIAGRILIKPDTMRKYAKGYQPASERIMAMIEQLPAQIDRERKPTIVAEEHHSYGSGPRALLKNRREEMTLTIEDLAKLSKVPAAYIRQVEAGEVRGSNEKQLRRLATALKLDPEKLLGGSDHPRVIDEHRATFGATPDVALTGNLTAKTIPLISMAQAGDLVEFEDVYDYEGVIAYAGKDPRAIAVRIRGESMAPDYGEGTIAILYPSFKPQNENLVVAKLRDGSVLFKRLQIGDGEVILHSINPNYKPMRYAERDLVWIYPVGLTQKLEL